MWGLWQRHFPRPPGPRTEALLFQRRGCGSEPRSGNFLQDDLRAEGRGLQTTGSTNSFLNLCDFLRDGSFRGSFCSTALKIAPEDTGELCFGFRCCGTPLQSSCLEHPMDGGAWWAAVHGVAKSPTRLGDFTFTFHFHVSEKDMATHSSVLAWRIPGTGEPHGLPSMGSTQIRTRLK